MAVSAAGARAAELLYVPMRGAPVIQTYSLDLQLSGTFADLTSNPDLQEFRGVGFDAAHNFYAVQSASNSVMKFSSNGSLVDGNYITGLGDPWSIDVAANGDMLIMIGNFGSGTSVSKWTAASSTLTTNLITGISGGVNAIFGHDGNILVAQGGGVAQYSPSGSILNANYISNPGYTSSYSVLRFGANYLLNGVEGGGDGAVYQYPLTGGTAGTVRIGPGATSGVGMGYFYTVSSTGTLYNFNPGTAFINSWAANGSLASGTYVGFDVNYGIAHDVAAVPEPSILAGGLVMVGAAWGLIRRRQIARR